MSTVARLGDARSPADLASPRRGLDRLGPRRDTYGGVALTLFLVGALGYPVVGRVLGGAHLEADSLGRMTIVETGRANTVVGVGFFVMAVVVACVACYVRARERTGSAFSLFMQILVLWWVVLSVLIPRTPSLGAADLVILGAIPLVIGVVTSPPTLTTVRRLNLVRDLFAFGQVVYPFLAPDVARLPCRPDKCGIFGYLDTGFFTQENSGIAAVSLLLPLAGASSPRRLAVSSLLAALVALGSGSRTGLLSVVVAVAVAVYIRHLFANGSTSARVSFLVRAAPLVATLGSLGLFLFADPTALTGRGSVYAANLHALQGPALLYGVPWNTVEVASGGYLVSDHGQTSHIFAKAGLVGFLLWLAALLAILNRRPVGPEHALGLGVLGAGASRMLTESTFELEARTVGFLALLTVTGLCARRPQNGGDLARAIPSLRTATTTAACLAAAAGVVAVVPPLLPPVYRATTVLVATVPTTASTAAEESFRARAMVAASMESLATRLPVDTTLATTPAARLDDVRVAASRPLETQVLSLTTMSADATGAQRVNDAVARSLESTLSSDQALKNARVEVKALGLSTASEVNPWTGHLAATLTLSSLGAACVVWCGWRGLRRDRRRAPHADDARP